MKDAVLQFNYYKRNTAVTVSGQGKCDLQPDNFYIMPKIFKQYDLNGRL
jgi:hypothetical protein